MSLKSSTIKYTIQFENVKCQDWYKCIEAKPNMSVTNLVALSIELIYYCAIAVADISFIFFTSFCKIHLTLYTDHALQTESNLIF